MVYELATFTAADQYTDYVAVLANQKADISISGTFTELIVYVQRNLVDPTEAGYWKNCEAHTDVTETTSDCSSGSNCWYRLYCTAITTGSADVIIASDVSAEVAARLATVPSLEKKPLINVRKAPKRYA